MSCKAKNCAFYKICAAKSECTEHHCADYFRKPDKKKKEDKNDNN